MKKSSDFLKKVEVSYDVYNLAPRKNIIRESREIEDILSFAPTFSVQRFLHEKRQDRLILRHVNFRICSIHFLCSGRYFYRFDGKEIVLNPGEVFVQTPGSCVEMGSPEGFGSDRLILFLTGSLLPALMRRLGLISPLRIQPENPGRIKAFFESFEPLLRNEKRLPELIGKTAELLTLLAEIHGTFHKALPDKMAWALKYIQKNLKTGFSAEELSEYLKLTQSAVRKQFAECFGCTPLELLRRERLKCAAEMLESSGLSIKEISLQCGFSTPRYFSDAFRKEYRISPRSYLKKKGV